MGERAAPPGDLTLGDALQLEGRDSRGESLSPDEREALDEARRRLAPIAARAKQMLRDAEPMMRVYRSLPLAVKRRYRDRTPSSCRHDPIFRAALVGSAPRARESRPARSHGGSRSRRTSTSRDDGSEPPGEPPLALWRHPKHGLLAAFLDRQEAVEC